MSKPYSNQHHPYLNRLRKWRTPIFNFSLLLSLGLVTYAFSWTTYPVKGKVEGVIEIPMDSEVPITRTKHEVKRTPPPPIMKPSTEVIPDDVEYETEPEPKLVEKEVIVDDIEPRDIIAKPVVKKVAPPKIIPVEEPDVVETIHVVVEEMPRFKGCEDITNDKKEREKCAINKLLAYIYSKIKYPPIARENGIEGVVVVQFTIEKDGNITDINILKEIGGGCGAEAARVVKGMPEWIPGKQRGKKVRVRYNLPVRYSLQ